MFIKRELMLGIKCSLKWIFHRTSQFQMIILVKKRHQPFPGHQSNINNLLDQNPIIEQSSRTDKNNFRRIFNHVNIPRKMISITFQLIVSHQISRVDLFASLLYLTVFSKLHLYLQIEHYYFVNFRCRNLNIYCLIQTVAKICTGRSSTIIYPVPLDISMETFMKD